MIGTVFYLKLKVLKHNSFLKNYNEEDIFINSHPESNSRAYYANPVLDEVIMSVFTA